MRDAITAWPSVALRLPLKPLGLGAALMVLGLVIVVAGLPGAGGAFGSTALQHYCLGLLFIASLTCWEFSRPRTGVLPAWASPPALIAFWALTWVYAPALVAFGDESLLDEMVVAQGGEAVLVTGLLLACFALTTLSFSFHAASIALRRVSSEAARVEHSSTLPVVVVLYLVSATARAFRLLALGIAFGSDLASWGPLQSVDQWIGYIEDLRFLALALLVAHVIRQRTGRLWLAMALVTELMFGGTSGFLMHLIRPIVLCVAVAAALDRLRIRYFALMGAAILLVVTFYPVVVAIREDRTGAIGASYRGGVSGALTDTGTYWLGGLSRLDSAYEKYFGRQTEVAGGTGLVVALTPAVVPFEGLEKFLMIPTNLIPRVLWPDKPILSRGQWFSVTFRGLDEDTTSWSAMTIFSEGYLFFGWTGVALAMLIAGALLAFFHRILNTPRLAMVYLALVPTILELEPELSSYLTSLVQRSIVFVIAFLVIAHRPAKGVTVNRVMR